MASKARSSRTLVGTYSRFRERRGEPTQRSRRLDRLPSTIKLLDRISLPPKKVFTPAAVDDLSRRKFLTRQRLVQKARWLPAKQALTNKPLKKLSTRLALDEHTRSRTICQDRAERKETLFALGVAGRSGGSPGRNGKYHKTSNSLVNCRRK